MPHRTDDIADGWGLFEIERFPRPGPARCDRLKVCRHPNQSESGSLGRSLHVRRKCASRPLRQGLTEYEAPALSSDFPQARNHDIGSVLIRQQTRQIVLKARLSKQRTQTLAYELL